MPSTYTRNVLTLVSKHMEHQECPKLRRIVSFKIQLSRQCTRVHNDGRNIGKTDNRSCNCTWWRGEGLRVLRQCLLEPGTWRCPLFPIPSRLDPFGKVLLPLQRSILVPENMSEENGTALLPMFVGACLAARWLYNLRVSECISHVAVCPSCHLSFHHTLPPALFLLLLLSLLCCCQWWWLPVHISERLVILATSWEAGIYQL